ncbi:uncharacterized protein [Palaemon carinicauda]|uniref:uncharacterized protein n=1 Tax=Palaemon carinicauda TaxID=392227 RepID=UPI0035B62DC7
MDMIKPFTGKGDVVSWLKKVTLVAKLQKIVDLASFIPLYLEGDALALYLEMGDEDQECAAKIQKKLKVAFSDDPFSAFGKLFQLKWTGEPDDVYANEQLPNVMTMAMSEFISHARILSSKQQGGVVAVTVRKCGEGGGAKHENRARPFQFRGVVYISAFDGSHIKCKVVDCVELGVNVKSVTVRAVVSNQLVNGVDVVLGVDVIDQLGSVTVTQGKVCFGAFGVASVVQEIKHRLGGERDKNSLTVVIEDPDFHARFDGQKWTVRWFWENKETVTLKNKVSCYDKKLDGWKKEEFEKEEDRSIAEGILVPWKEKVDVGIIPLMAVEQPTKNKVRPVLDFRELNVNVKCHTGDDVTDVCRETLRKWRQTGENVSVVDLKSAYLQLSVDEKLWPYQLVNYKGQTFCLTRLGFGLNSAPRIMSRILKTVLSKDEKIERATNSYIDDILVNESIASTDEVIRHLNTFGLITKSPESLNGGAALGLQLQRVGGE